MSNVNINLPPGRVGDKSEQPLINFQLDNLSIQEKSKFSYGVQLAQSVESWANGGFSNYFWVRNARWRTNRMYANGRVDMRRFMDLLEFNGKENYVNINWQCIHIVNRIVSGLVGRWMNTKNEKIQVTAIDTLSTKQKQDQYEQLNFYIENKRMIEQLQEQSGVQMIPEDEGLPEDKEELNLWQLQFQRLPEEILYEMGCNDVLQSCGWFDVLKEKMLHDSAETGFVGTYTWMDDEGVIHVDWLQPENCIYSYSRFPDFRDTTMRGYMTTYKISELRKKYSREFHPNNPNALTEEQLFDMAKTAKEYQMYDNISWNTEWNVIYLRPYDEWNVNILEFEIRTIDSEPYTETITEKNKSTILRKGRPEKVRPNQKIIEDSKVNIYRGVYARDTQRMLEWGLKKNMIRPQDPKEIGNAEFSYSFYMVQNYDMMCMAIPEKIQEPADQMIIARLKIQQLVAKMRPPGTAINWRAVQNIDYGLGEGNKSIDFKKMFDQTGDFYYHDKDAEGNPIGVPFTEIPNAGFLPQLQGLILLYDKHYQILKDELGEDPNLITQAAQPRVAVQNIETSQQQAAFATDYFYLAYKNVLIDTSRKVSCLLKTSVVYGADAYRNIIKQEDIKDRIFTTKVNMLPDAFELQRFEAMMNQTIAASPELLSFLDPFRLMRVAKEDVKLAELLFRHAQKKLIQYQQQTARENQEATFNAQIASAKVSEEEKRKTKEMEVDGDIKKGQQTALAQNQSAVLSLVATLLKPSGEGGAAGTIPPELKPLVNAVIDNIMVGAVASTEEQKMAIRQQIQQSRQAEQEQLMMQEQMQPEIQNQPQEMAA